MRYPICLLLAALLLSCGEIDSQKRFEAFQRVEVVELLVDSTLNVRALEFMGSSEIVFPHYALGNYLYSFNASEPNGFGIDMTSNVSYEFTDNEVKIDTIPEFQIRSIASTNEFVYLLNIQSPAAILKTRVNLSWHGKKDDIHLQIVDYDPKAFYDSMEFWNDQEGIAMGDPTDDCLSVIITRDGGETWKKLSCDALPKAAEGEAAFAASDTNIAIVGDHTWLFSGGVKSRVYYSSDKGETWEVFDTPIIQGKPTQGIYSGTFYDENRGIVVGGDYTQPEANTGNKAVTKDGGRTWQLVSEGSGIGYKSCVQYVPGSDAQGVVAIGFTGIAHSADGGQSWKDLSEEGFYTLRFVNDSVAYAAGRSRVAKLTFKR